MSRRVFAQACTAETSTAERTLKSSTWDLNTSTEEAIILKGGALRPTLSISLTYLDIFTFISSGSKRRAEVKALKCSYLSQYWLQLFDGRPLRMAMTFGRVVMSRANGAAPFGRTAPLTTARSQFSSNLPPSPWIPALITAPGGSQRLNEAAYWVIRKR